MSRETVKIKNWPFGLREKVKLIWIGEPYKEKNKWMVNAYFKGSNSTRKIPLDWADIHFLSVDKCYTDGNLNTGEMINNTEVININLNGVRGEYRERDWEIWANGNKEKTKSKTFNFILNGELYTVPIIEVIRAVIAPDRFTLNRVVEMDTLENYFTYNFDGKKLDMFFTSEYEPKLLKNEKINHLAWIVTNPQIFKMFNSIGKNIWEKGQLNFDFLFDRFSIKARVERREKYNRVLQILTLNKKRINSEEINIYHPCLEDIELSNTSLKKRVFRKNGDKDIELDSGIDGSINDSEEIETFMISHEYEKFTQINRRKNGKRTLSHKEDDHTKIYIVQDDRIRTTADEGGETTALGLEFSNLNDLEEISELQEFIHILKLLEMRHEVSNIQIIIHDLPEGTKGKRFSRLKDGVKKRKYAIGKVIMVDGKENCFIEIEREERALSMIIIKSSSAIDWKKICSIMLLGLVNESGTWSKNVINQLKSQGLEIIRKKHVDKSLCEKAELFFDMLT